LAAWQLVLVWAVITLVGDVIMAMTMAAVAPVRVLAGPGDRRLDGDDVRELAVVVSEFDSAQLGSVRVRGEIWRARLAAGEAETPTLGAKMRIVDRDGLTLVVSHHAG
jgi:membrane protein implicated in regulation of membrane protease activity